MHIQWNFASKFIIDREGRVAARLDEWRDAEPEVIKLL
jgi:glutathione peroxidase-family protein